MFRKAFTFDPDNQTVPLGFGGNEQITRVRLVIPPPRVVREDRISTCMGALEYSVG